MSEWPTVKLGEVAEQTNHRVGELDVPIYSVTKYDGFVPSSEYFKKRVFSMDIRKYKLCTAGDFAYATIHLDEGSIGISPVKCGISPMYTTFRLNSLNISPDYLLRYLKSSRALTQYLTLGSGSAERRKSIKFTDLRKMEIPFPPLGEQKRIAEILGEASKTIKDTEKIIHNAQGLKRSSLRGILDNKSGEYVQLSQISSVQSGITKGRKVQNGITLMPTPYMAVSNVKAGYLDLSEVKQIDASEAEVNRYQLQAGDILLTEGGDPDKLGRGTIWRNEIPGAIHQNHIFRVRINPDSGFTSEALMAILESTESKGYFLRSAKQTTGISSINKRQLSATPIPVLGKVQVEELTNMWHKIDEVIELYHRKLSLLQELQKSLANRAFAGLL